MQIKEMEVTFSSEALPGETLTMNSSSDLSGIPNQIYIEGIKTSDAQIAFKAIVNKV